jgi:hypothetical protein
MTNLKTLSKPKRLELLAPMFQSQTGLDIRSDKIDVAVFTTDPLLITDKNTTVTAVAALEAGDTRPYYLFYQLPEARVGVRKRVACYHFPQGWHRSLKEVAAQHKINSCSIPIDLYKRFGELVYIAQV